MADLFAPARGLVAGQATLDDVAQALAQGADPNKWEGPLSPIRFAVQAHHVELLGLLLQSGADVNQKDSRGVAVLHQAVFDGKGDCITKLLDAGADIDVRDRHEQTPLFFAPTRQICELLITRRADVNVVNSKKQSPLHLAAYAGLDDAVSCLIDAKKNLLQAQDQHGHTPLYYAAHAKLRTTVNVLKKRGAESVRSRERRGKKSPGPHGKSPEPGARRAPQPPRPQLVREAEAAPPGSEARATAADSAALQAVRVEDGEVEAERIVEVAFDASGEAGLEEDQQQRSARLQCQGALEAGLAREADQFHAAKLECSAALVASSGADASAPLQRDAGEQAAAPSTSELHAARQQCQGALEAALVVEADEVCAAKQECSAAAATGFAQQQQQQVRQPVLLQPEEANLEARLKEHQQQHAARQQCQDALEAGLANDADQVRTAKLECSAALAASPAPGASAPPQAGRDAGGQAAAPSTMEREQEEGLRAAKRQCQDALEAGLAKETDLVHTARLECSAALEARPAAAPSTSEWEQEEELRAAGRQCQDALEAGLARETEQFLTAKVECSAALAASLAPAASALAQAGRDAGEPTAEPDQEEGLRAATGQCQDALQAGLARETEQLHTARLECSAALAASPAPAASAPAQAGRDAGEPTAPSTTEPDQEEGLRAATGQCQDALEAGLAKETDQFHTAKLECSAALVASSAPAASAPAASAPAQAGLDEIEQTSAPSSSEREQDTELCAARQQCQDALESQLAKETDQFHAAKLECSAALAASSAPGGSAPLQRDAGEQTSVPSTVEREQGEELLAARQQCQAALEAALEREADEVRAARQNCSAAAASGFAQEELHEARKQCQGALEAGLARETDLYLTAKFECSAAVAVSPAPGGSALAKAERDIGEETSAPSTLEREQGEELHAARQQCQGALEAALEREADEVRAARQNCSAAAASGIAQSELQAGRQQCQGALESALVREADLVSAARQECSAAAAAGFANGQEHAARQQCQGALEAALEREADEVRAARQTCSAAAASGIAQEAAQPVVAQVQPGFVGSAVPPGPEDQQQEQEQQVLQPVLPQCEEASPPAHQHPEQQQQQASQPVLPQVTLTGAEEEGILPVPGTDSPEDLREQQQRIHSAQARLQAGGSLDGVWNLDDQTVRISGNQVLWSDGVVWLLEKDDQDRLMVAVGNSTYYAKLAGSTIEWSDGDIWIREEPQPVDAPGEAAQAPPEASQVQEVQVLVAAPPEAAAPPPQAAEPPPQAAAPQPGDDAQATQGSAREQAGPGDAPAAPAPQAAPASVHGFHRRDQVEVWSNSKGKWLPGTVKRVYPEDTVADGYEMPKNTIKVESAAGTKYIIEAEIHATVRHKQVASEAEQPEPREPPAADAAAAGGRQRARSPAEMAAMAARGAKAASGAGPRAAGLAAVGSEEVSNPGGDDKQDVPHVTEQDGCLHWEVTLKKEAVEDKFGFVQANGRLDFESRMMSLSQRSPQHARSPSKPPPASAPESLIVRKVHDHGLLRLWNLRHRGAEVRPLDRIVRVNGEATVEGMQREIRSRRVLMNIVRYPDLFEVTLSKDGGKKLGFRFEKPSSPTAEGVRITEVLAEGALPEHNTGQLTLDRWHYVVLPDMRIESVNGISGDSVQIAAELKRAGAVRLVVRRAEQEATIRQQMRQRMTELAATAGSGSADSRSPNGAKAGSGLT